MEDVTFCLTSCGRPDLLERTIDSFLKYNTYKIKDYLLYEDQNSNSNSIIDLITKKYPFIKIVSRGNRVGQRQAIDEMYSHVSTDYIYHCEDDWEFYDYSFIEKSKDVLIKDEKILQVHNRYKNDLNGHPVDDTKIVELDSYKLQYDYMGIWNGFSFNPGIRRKRDYDIIGKYTSYTYEHEISIKYKELGYYAVVLDGDGYVKHIGYERHVKDPTNGV